ncbi:O-6-methylguanine DNA methyltransferase [Antricoccus suffuscus]|uniref:O-6-methylguanine DNA methyltransferase n=1 Tax=Antricoccus suffuscus TaxID=1629062 RepID=A0A2T0ZZB6_9ACTN|nr:MGMT family protein [Antricoccus suffuscus]PRZ41695.1 O-6-methylguanine DNA methyltransferase [Antricoccus suffuscus]
MYTRHALVETKIEQVMIVASDNVVTRLCFMHGTNQPSPETSGEEVTIGRDDPRSERVGKAVDANSLCIFIPCHRVLSGDGRLTDYAGGPEWKRALMDLESSAQTHAGRWFFCDR